MPSAPSFPDYQVLELLGAGSMGRVYLARHAGGQVHALKVLPAEFAADEALRERFARELQTLRVLGNHPNLVTMHGAGRTAAGLPFFAMDYVEGQTLKVKLREGLPVADALDVLETVADAVGHAHRMGLVHRDVKPENVMVCGDGSVRLLDFGLVKAVHGTGQRLTLTGEVVGTPSYMAREQLADPAAGLVGPRTDVYSLGAILYEVFAQTPPLVGQTSLEIYTKLQDGELPPPLGEHPELNAELRQLCLEALDHDPRRRPADGWSFRDRLRAARRPPDRSAGGGLGTLGWLAVAAALGVGLVVGLVVGLQARDRSAPPASAAQPNESTSPSPTPQVHMAAEDVGLIPLSEVPRLGQVELGTRVTAEHDEGFQLAVVIPDEDGRLTLHFSDGESEQLDPPEGGWLPDLFLPGAVVVAQGQRARIVERRGLAVYLRWEAGGYASWYGLRELTLDPGLVPRPSTPMSPPRPVLARYKRRKTWYPAVELARSDDAVWVIYFEDDSFEWLDSDDVRPYPAIGSTVVFDGSPDQEVELVRDLGGVAAMVRTEDGGLAVVSWWQLEVPN